MDIVKVPIDNNSELWRPATGTKSLAYPASSGVLFIATSLLIGIGVRYLLIRVALKIQLSYSIIMLIIGALIGLCVNCYPSVKPLVSVCYYDVDILMILFLPILIFNTTYSVDTHAFWKCFSQILIVGVAGALLTSILASLIAYFVIESTWDFPTAVMFGAACVSIYPGEVVEKLKQTTHGRSTAIVLLGEGLVGDASSMIIFQTVFGVISFALSQFSQIAILLLRLFFGGILFGIFMGLLTNVLISSSYNDITAVGTVTVASTYFTYYFSEYFLYVSGYIACIVSGIMVSSNKSEISTDIEPTLADMWRALAFFANTLIFTMTGVVIFEHLPLVISFRQLALIFVTYMTVYAARVSVYGMLTPFLGMVGYGIKWQQGIACSWGGLKGPLSLCLALIVLQAMHGSRYIKGIFIVQITGIVCLSLVLNATTVSKVLKVLGLTGISLAKKANMTNCVKRIISTRDRCMSMAKMDKFLSDANWDLVEQGTTINHPYQMQLSNNSEDSDDDTYMGYRYTTCPDCDREIPNEPTKKEFAEMTREANQRILKAMKISYWRQFEHGKLSKEGVRTLVQAIEIAADTDAGRINLDQLEQLWRPKPAVVWLRCKILNWLARDKDTVEMSENHCRIWFYRVVSNVWFETFIFVAIFLNTPVIFCEVFCETLSKTNNVTNVLIAVKILNIIFFSIYVSEMLLKMIAYGFMGYFKSIWNRLDFFIVLIAVIDFAMDVADLNSSRLKLMQGNQSSLVAGVKLIRILRFLRLFKLASLQSALRLIMTIITLSNYATQCCRRVSVPKVLGSIDHIIDNQLSYGYDVGKGFVTGKQEVCKLLPQLVDDKTIQADLNKKLEYDRLQVTKQLGLLQRDRPWTAITVKTRHATTSTLHVMLLDAMKLKEEGFLDDTEIKLLVGSINEKIQQARRQDTLIAPCSPETQLRAISWLQGNPRVADFFMENSEMINFNSGEVLITLGDEPKGLYILVGGMLEMTYSPPMADIDEAIPNHEFLSDLRYGEPSQDYIVPGNTIGIVGILTNRPYNYGVRCETAVQAYYITMATVKEAFNLAPHPIYGLEAAMWREIGIKIALLLLPTTPSYHGWSYEKLSMHLEHSFVPCLSAFKVFSVNELMEDIMLLDGICQDMHTREVFQPPCYIPRTAHRLIFPKSSQLVVTPGCPETKLLIIASKDADGIDIMEDEFDLGQCELVSNASSRCLYHSIVKQPSNDSRARKRRRYGNRRLNFRGSVWTKNVSVNSQENTQASALKRFAPQYKADHPQAFGTESRTSRSLDLTPVPELPEQEISSTSYTSKER